MTTPPPITAERMRELAADASVRREVCDALRAGADALDRLAEAERKLRGHQQECREVEQILGRALSYPWYKDDQKNFPGATEADGVCIGEHAPATLAAEAARCLAEAERQALWDAKVIAWFAANIQFTPAPWTWETVERATRISEGARQPKAQPPQTERTL